MLFNGSDNAMNNTTPNKMIPEYHIFLGSLEISLASTSCSISASALPSCLGKKCLPIVTM